MKFRIKKISAAALSFGLRASVAVLAATLLILVFAGDFSMSTYNLWRLAAELWRVPVAVMLMASVIAAAA